MKAAFTRSPCHGRRPHGCPQGTALSTGCADPPWALSLTCHPGQMSWRATAEELRFLREAMPEGVATIAQLEGLGVRSSTAYHRCRPGGVWRRLLPGVVLLHDGPPSRRQRLRAALLYCGSASLVTGLAACQLRGIRTVRTPTVHVAVPAGRQVRSAEFIIVERTTRLPARMLAQGVPCTPPERAVLDAARRLGSLDAVRDLLADAVQGRHCTVAALRTEIDRGSRRGTAVARIVLAQISDGVRSVAEADARVLWRRTGLPPLAWNATVTDAHGRFIAVPDGWADDVAMAWEIDSYAFHLSPAAYRKTLDRHSRMTSSGIVVVHTLPARIRKEPATVRAELRGAYEAAARRPRPPLLVARAA